MTKQKLTRILLSLLSVLAVACGDAGVAEVDEEPGFGGEVGDNDDANVEEELDNEVDDEQKVDEEEEGPLCGDGFVDATEECDDGNDQDIDGCSSVCELEVLEVEGQMSIDLVVDSLVSNDAPLEDSCSGAIDLGLDTGALKGEGSCLLDTNANFLEYSLTAQVDASGAVEGEVEITLNGRPHSLVVEGTLDEGVLFLEFDGVTLATTNIRLVWNGVIDAEFN